MKRFFKDLSSGCTASVKESNDGRARLVVKSRSGKKIHDKEHATPRAAYSAFRRMCN